MPSQHGYYEFQTFKRTASFLLALPVCCICSLQGGIFIALEFLTRRTLSRAIGTDAPEGTDWISRALVRSKFPMKEAFRQAAGVASALAYMHDSAIPVS